MTFCSSWPSLPLSTLNSPLSLSPNDGFFLCVPPGDIGLDGVSDAVDCVCEVVLCAGVEGRSLDVDVEIGAGVAAVLLSECEVDDGVVAEEEVWAAEGTTGGVEWVESTALDGVESSALEAAGVSPWVPVADEGETGVASEGSLSVDARFSTFWGERWSIGAPSLRSPRLDEMPVPELMGPPVEVSGSEPWVLMWSAEDETTGWRG